MDRPHLPLAAPSPTRGPGGGERRVHEVEATVGRAREAVEESSRATDELDHTVSRLAELIGAFKV